MLLQKTWNKHNIDGCCGYILATCACMMHLFACWCFSLLLGRDMGLPACLCEVCVFVFCARHSAGKLRCWVLPGTAEPGFGNRGPSTFLMCPPFKSCAASPLACAGPFFCLMVSMAKNMTDTKYFLLFFLIRVSQCCVLCVCQFVSSCLLVHSQPLVVRLAATTAAWFSVRQQRRQLKQCTVLQGLFRAAKALRVLQGRPVRNGTRLEI